MIYSMYQASIPRFVHGLRSLGAVLEKGREDAIAREFAPEVLLQSRLAPDMFPLIAQVQIACDVVKKGAGRLTAIDPPAFADTETTFEQAQERIANTIVFLDSVTEAQFEGAENRPIVLTFPGREIRFIGTDYLAQFVIPNFYFHLTAAYAILRHNGVKIGKLDFLGGQ